MPLLSRIDSVDSTSSQLRRLTQQLSTTPVEQRLRFGLFSSRMVYGDYVVYCFCLCVWGSRRRRNRRTLAADILYRSFQNVRKFGILIDGAYWWTLTQKVPLGLQNTEGCKKIVTLFSYTVWPSSMKFGTVSGLTNGHLFPEFSEVWPTFPGSKNSPRRISCTFFVGARLNLAALGLLVHSMS